MSNQLSPSREYAGICNLFFFNVVRNYCIPKGMYFNTEEAHRSIFRGYIEIAKRLN